MIVIPEEARMQSYIKKEIVIQAGNRCCKSHVLKNRIYEDDLGCLQVYSNTAT